VPRADLGALRGSTARDRGARPARRPARSGARRPSSRTTGRAPRLATASRACPPTRRRACSRISERS